MGLESMVPKKLIWALIAIFGGVIIIWIAIEQGGIIGIGMGLAVIISVLIRYFFLRGWGAWVKKRKESE